MGEGWGGGEEPARDRRKTRITRICFTPSPYPSPARGEGTLRSANFNKLLSPDTVFDPACGPDGATRNPGTGVIANRMFPHCAGASCGLLVAPCPRTRAGSRTMRLFRTVVRLRGNDGREESPQAISLLRRTANSAHRCTDGVPSPSGTTAWMQEVRPQGRGR
jgi:hypothetical protein